MKKIISILVAVVMLSCFMVTTAFAEEATTASVSGGNVTGVTNEIAGVPVTISNESGFAAYKVVLTYSAEDLKVESVSGNGIQSNTNTAGRIVVTFGSSENITSNAFTVNFTVLGKCGSYPVSVAVEQLFAYDENGEKLVLQYGASNGSVTVEHNWVAGTPVAATCTTDGYTPYTCSICGKVENRDIVPAAHKYGEGVVTAPTCTEAGYTTYTCSVCGDSYTANEVPALGHDWAEATCTAPKTCKVCGATEGEALGHDWAEATCTAPKTCKVCGATEGDALGHDMQESSPAVAAGCLTEGKTAGYKCSRCDHEIKPEAIAALGHDVDYKAYEKDKDNHWHVCKRCGELIDVEKHAYVQEIGDKLYCECGLYIDKPVDPDDGDKDEQPKNGDITPHIVMGTVAIVSACAAVAYVYKRKFVK